MRLTCSKKFSGYAFAHRQPKHDGQCRWLHGHNWDFTIEFQAATLEENGFVIDFGKLGFIKMLLTQAFDHGLILAKNDPELETFKLLATRNICKLTILEDVSAEGLAKQIHALSDELVRKHTNGRVWVSRVTVHEDEKNTASYEPATSC